MKELVNEDAKIGKDKNSKPLFEELLECAFKAALAGKIEIRHLTQTAILFRIINSDVARSYDSCCCSDTITGGIEFIESIHNENFMVETKDDVKRIRSDAKVTSSSGEILTKELMGMLLIHEEDLVFPVFKGATVEQ